MSVLKKRKIIWLLLIIPVFGLLVWLTGRDLAEQPVTLASGERHLDRMRRINPDQYLNIIRDVFGPTIDVAGRFVETEQRADGLLAVGATKVSISSMGFEATDKMARNIARQVFAEGRRQEYVSCRPTSADTFDRACAQQFIERTGRLLFRRPLSEAEKQLQMGIVARAARQENNFYSGLETGLSNMLVSPNFLFRMERAEPDPEKKGALRLTAYSKASRLSFLLWNSAPDPALLDAAERGELHTQKGLRKQVDRMMLSPRLHQGMRAFFADMLELDRFDLLSKDRKIYPQFTLQVTQDAREQVLRTLEDHLLVQDDDYRDLFITRKTFLTPSLAALFDIPLVQANAYGAPDEWEPYEFPQGDPRIGILAQPGFVALHSHAGRTSPTLRGKALRENLLCQEVPPPPPNVDFNIIEDTSNPNFKTTRQRLSAHAVMPTCAGCHKITDPIGLALETFDGDGSFRTTENGVNIDTSGEMDGTTYKDAVELAHVLRDNPSVVSCLVKRVYSYGVGREIASNERKLIKKLRKSFADDGYRWRPLLREIATSDAFYQGHMIDKKQVVQR